MAYIICDYVVVDIYLYVADCGTKAKKKKKSRYPPGAFDMHDRRLPNGIMYEKSYMHRDHVTHTLVTKTDFIVTTSKDGFIKFWKKISGGIEFVKQYKAHSGTHPLILILLLSWLTCQCLHMCMYSSNHSNCSISRWFLIGIMFSRSYHQIL
jgi:hypothetical protein